MTGPTTRPEPTDERRADAGRALIEVLILGVLLLIPTVYVLSAVLRVQSATFAVTQAARDAGRLIDTAPDLDSGVQRATEAARIALADQRLPGDAVSVRFVAPGAGCSAAAISPSLTAGAIFDICVTTPLTLPGVPSALTDNNTVTGVYTLHVGQYRESR
jgi:hypothetical protein